MMEQLGHASITTTANLYGHVLDQAKRQMAERTNQLATDVTPGCQKGPG
ncbi:hypothetical protein [Amycolatopsis thermoflava]